MAEFFGKNTLCLLFGLVAIFVMAMNLLLSCLILYQIQVNKRNSCLDYIIYITIVSFSIFPVSYTHLTLPTIYSV